MNGDVSLNLRDLLYVLKKRFKFILAVTIGSTLISGVFTFSVIKPTYEAKTTIVIGKADGGKDDKSQYNYNDIMMFQKLVKTYSEIGKSESVAENASAKLGNISPEQIQKALTVTPQADTQIVELKVESNNPEKAYLMMNAVSNSFIQESKRIYPLGNIQVMDGAKIPQKPIKPNKLLNIFAAFVIGLMVSVGISFVLEYMDSTIKTEDDINKYLGLPVIGIVPINAVKDGN
jgi:Capsular polysaccharide biosynthesis protein